MEGPGNNQGAPSYGWEKLLQDFTFKADRISHALSRFTESAGETDVAVDAEWLLGLAGDDAAKPATWEATSGSTLMEPQPWPVQDDGLARRYLKEVELRDVVITRQADEVSEMRGQLHRHKDIISDLQREIAEVRDKLSRMDTLRQEQRAYQPEPGIRQRAAASPRPAPLPVREAPPPEPAPQPRVQRFIPSAMAPEDVPVRPRSLKPYGAEPPEKDSEGMDEPQDIREILRKGGGAKLYDI